MNDSSRFSAIFQSIKNFIEESEHDVLTIDGKRFCLYLSSNQVNWIESNKTLFSIYDFRLRCKYSRKEKKIDSTFVFLKTSHLKILRFSQIWIPKKKRVLYIYEINLTMVSSALDAEKIESKQEERNDILHRADSLNLLIFTTLLVIVVLTVWVFKRRKFRYLHETFLALVYGSLNEWTFSLIYVWWIRIYHWSYSSTYDFEC